MPHPSRGRYPAGQPQRGSSPGRGVVRPRSVVEVLDRAPASGRHALDEDALFTPIFHALAGGPPPSPSPVDPVERFRRDPLTAPLPVVVPARRRPEGAHARTESTGRHHRRPARVPH